MTSYGVILPTEHVTAAEAAGADYVEPTIVGNVVVPGASGRWVMNPEYRGAERSPSFAVLFPRDIRLSDPSFSREVITRYLEDVLGAVGGVAEQDALIVFGSGAARTIPDDVDSAVGARRFAEVLVEARDIAAGNGVRIILEPLHRGETNLVNTIVEAAAFLDEHGIDGVPIVADLFHIMYEEEPFEAVRAHADRIGHAHIADTDRRPPGQGDWPLREFLTALRDGGYTGDVSIECHWNDVEAELAPALAAVRSAAA
jgi:D-psicose/D-tagatose/L-ribulose 3-epimerase